MVTAIQYLSLMDREAAGMKRCRYSHTPLIATAGGSYLYIPLRSVSIALYPNPLILGYIGI